MRTPRFLPLVLATAALPQTRIGIATVVVGDLRLGGFTPLQSSTLRAGLAEGSRRIAQWPLGARDRTPTHA